MLHKPSNTLTAVQYSAYMVISLSQKYFVFIHRRSKKNYNKCKSCIYKSQGKPESLRDKYLLHQLGRSAVTALLYDATTESLDEFKREEALQVRCRSAASLTFSHSSKINGPWQCWPLCIIQYLHFPHKHECAH